MQLLPPEPDWLLGLSVFIRCDRQEQSCNHQHACQAVGKTTVPETNVYVIQAILIKYSGRTQYWRKKEEKKSPREKHEEHTKVKRQKRLDWQEWMKRRSKYFNCIYTDCLPCCFSFMTEGGKCIFVDGSLGGVYSVAMDVPFACIIYNVCCHEVVRSFGPYLSLIFPWYKATASWNSSWDQPTSDLPPCTSIWL